MLLTGNAVSPEVFYFIWTV